MPQNADRPPVRFGETGFVAKIDGMAVFLFLQNALPLGNGPRDAMNGFAIAVSQVGLNFRNFYGHRCPPTKTGRSLSYRAFIVR